jgi:hypothetical protein
MIWIRRRLSTETWATSPIMDLFEEHFINAGSPNSMLMIEEPHPPLDLTIWIRLADKTQVTGYPGFEEAPDDQLPGEAGLLIGHIGEFESCSGISWMRSEPASPALRQLLVAGG